METPSSLRMMSLSQKGKQEGSARTNNANERSALLDITNDSPIVGLATTTDDLSENTPSGAAKNRVVPAKNTPGSGEALLRWQVRTLLQKVEEEGEFLNKISLAEDRPSLRVLLDLPGPSPMQILAPTPANTPQILSLSAEAGPALMDAVEEEEEQDEEEEEEAVSSIPAEDSLVNRALLFDSPGKSEESSNADSSSALTYQGSTERSTDDDNSSAWSLQVNRQVDDYDDDDVEGIEEFGTEEEEEGDDYNELCAGISKMMSVKKAGGGLPEFMGKHSRFVYNSDGDDEEIEREEVIKEKISPDVLLLRGLPVPEGKHLRFHQEEEDEE